MSGALWTDSRSKRMTSVAAFHLKENQRDQRSVLPLIRDQQGKSTDLEQGARTSNEFPYAELSSSWYGPLNTRPTRSGSKSPANRSRTVHAWSDKRGWLKPEFIWRHSQQEKYEHDRVCSCAQLWACGWNSWTARWVSAAFLRFHRSRLLVLWKPRVFDVFCVPFQVVKLRLCEPRRIPTSKHLCVEKILCLWLPDERKT